MALEAKSRRVNPQKSGKTAFPVRVVTGYASHLPVFVQRQTFDLHRRNNINLVFLRIFSIGMTAETQLRKRRFERRPFCHAVRGMAVITLMLLRRESICGERKYDQKNEQCLHISSFDKFTIARNVRFAAGLPIK
jgi:hypothetical protein